MNELKLLRQNQILIRPHLFNITHKLLAIPSPLDQSDKKGFMHKSEAFHMNKDARSEWLGKRIIFNAIHITTDKRLTSC